MKRILLACLLALAFAANTHAQSPDSVPAVSDAWARATPSPSSNAAVYFTVTLKSGEDTLTGATTPVASDAKLHESKMENGIMKMRPIDSLTVDQDHPIKLAPGGYHLMLTGMKQQLKAGDTFPLTLTFAHAGSVSTQVKVQKAGAMAPDMPGMDMKGMDMGH